MPRRAFKPPAICELCSQPPPLGETLHHRDGWLCATCLANNTRGKDAISKTAFYASTAQFDRTMAMRCEGGDEESALDHELVARWQADAADLLMEAGNNRARAARVALGEVVPEEPGFLRETLTIPNLAALDASIDRTRLLTAHGIDALALALDAVNSAGAKSSLEKMHIHQLAVLHKTALEQICNTQYTSDPDRQIKHFQTASRLIRTFQQGIIALARLRGGGLPIVQHVHINEGAQAVVGTVQKTSSTNAGRAPADGR